jgi:hypothetical protein
VGRRLDAFRAWLRRSPLTLVASLAAALAFGLALLVGWATAGTREDLQRARPLPAEHAPPRLVLLGRAPALPKAPPARPGTRVRNPAKVPRLIVGSG